MEKLIPANYSLSDEIISNLKIIEPYYIFLLALIGLIGNSLSCWILVFSKIKLEKSNKVLAALAASDNVFLISLVAVYLRHFSIDVFNKYALICKFTVFSTYVSAFVSAWFVVEFSIERVIAVYFPIKRNYICTSTRSKCCSCFIMISAMLIYGMSLVTSGIEYFDSEKVDMCVPLNEWEKVSRVMVLYDVIFVIFMPFVIISITNMLIVVKLLNLKSPFKLLTHSISKSASIGSNYSLDLRKRSRLRSNKSNNSHLEINTLFERTIDNYNKNRQIRGNDDNVSCELEIFGQSPRHISNISNRIKTYSKTTTVLFTISTTFLILNCPIAILKLWYIIKNSRNEIAMGNSIKNLNTTKEYSLKINSTSSLNPSIDFITSPLEELAERISCYLYYLNFSLNFFLYNLNGSKFRNAILTIFKKKEPQKLIRITTLKVNNGKNNRLNSGKTNSNI